MRWRRPLANLLGFQATWLACVGGAALGYPLLGGVHPRRAWDAVVIGRLHQGGPDGSSVASPQADASGQGHSVPPRLAEHQTHPQVPRLEAPRAFLYLHGPLRRGLRDRG